MQEIFKKCLSSPKIVTESSFTPEVPSGSCVSSMPGEIPIPTTDIPSETQTRTSRTRHSAAATSLEFSPVDTDTPSTSVTVPSTTDQTSIPTDVSLPPTINLPPEIAISKIRKRPKLNVDESPNKRSKTNIEQIQVQYPELRVNLTRLPIDRYRLPETTENETKVVSEVNIKSEKCHSDGPSTSKTVVNPLDWGLVMEEDSTAKDNTPFADKSPGEFVFSFSLHAGM